MKTYQSIEKNYFPIRVFRAIANTIFIIVLCIGCGDKADEFVTANASTFTFNDLNTCDIGSGLSATSFDFSIAYDISEDAKITKILFDLEWSNGDSESSETTDFVDAGSRIDYDWCYRFGGDDWVEITHRLVTENDLTSNTSVIRVNKPDGAN